MPFDTFDEDRLDWARTIWELAHGITCDRDLMVALLYDLSDAQLGELTQLLIGMQEHGWVHQLDGVWAILAAEESRPPT